MRFISRLEDCLPERLSGPIRRIAPIGAILARLGRKLSR
jgi:hypothetical protein